MTRVFCVEMAVYNAHDVPKQYSQKFVHKIGKCHNIGTVGFVPNENIRQFFGDYHTFLKGCGVDGVKVDNQVHCYKIMVLYCAVMCEVLLVLQRERSSQKKNLYLSNNFG